MLDVFNAAVDEVIIGKGVTPTRDLELAALKIKLKELVPAMTSERSIWRLLDILRPWRLPEDLRFNCKEPILA
eukprot:6887331-Pyramimonas_sp.AAC.1